jgi:hypothetical protein
MKTAERQYKKMDVKLRARRPKQMNRERGILTVGK